MWAQITSNNSLYTTPTEMNILKCIQNQFGVLYLATVLCPIYQNHWNFAFHLISVITIIKISACYEVGWHKRGFQVILNTNLNFYVLSSNIISWIFVSEIIGKTGQWRTQNRINMQIFFLVDKWYFYLRLLRWAIWTRHSYLLLHEKGREFWQNTNPLCVLACPHISEGLRMSKLRFWVMMLNQHYHVHHVQYMNFHSYGFINSRQTN